MKALIRPEHSTESRGGKGKVGVGGKGKSGLGKFPTNVAELPPWKRGTVSPQGAGKDGKNALAVADYNPMQNILELNCNPSKPASYTCYVILKSLDRTDIRLYEYKLTAIP
jgi:hypothetical protein